MSGFETTDTSFNTGLEISGVLTTPTGAHSIAKLQFTNSYLPTSPLGVKFESGQPLAFFPEDDNPGDIENGTSTIVISGITYIIDEVQNEEGVTTLVLSYNG